ncbi:2-oxoacid:acceptor oxidoreductase family protein [Solemya velum gill symbiont]|uniref:2-oxoacid:acceptor oxidoreductase family protein n=1 Tax=Solemya velum gill symbiont TaxID=2340 RepID=UPI0009987A31|nr:2-oxoacid:acceptor oxidoreductase family protein [Solemya velum gill symbiont]OOY56310.1 pyruvate ferredoxin oxidoreductase [Solemya velum gill symbiont]OOY56647.1 pyruvate ferredoxin oxidoreductase [Solemya velum gill symbiont]OOY70195.1 pyruvate ferredoxin oxidoreductase [Solemya velum gill symbiont]OOY85836.1 pyruvate ferredoxin oxidoreductase [Solemya velum gill symbiont]OOY94642.1 pyruvate ferredoxin oxidoreductase [Solemya velum gill symbiont]
MFGNKKSKPAVKYPGTRMAMDGNAAVIMCEREASDAAGAYPITPSTQMGEYWAEEVAKGHVNTAGQPLIFVEPESEHAAAALTAGMSMSGLRATNFSSAQGVAFMHESLYAAVGKRLPYILNIGCRAITKASLNVHCGHDDYHCIDDTGFFQVFSKDAQEAADLNLIARKIAELSLTPAAVAQDGFLTTHLIEPLQVPERELIEEFLGYPADMIDCPTPAQEMIYGPKRRRVPEVWTVDNPMVAGTVQNQDAYMQATAAQRPYFFDHIRDISEEVMAEYTELTGRSYGRIAEYRCDDAEYVIFGQGSMIVQAEAVVDYLRETRKLKVGVINLTMYRPFPGDLVSKVLKGKKGCVVLERTDQPLAEDLPVMREVRSVIAKSLENGTADGELPFPDYVSYSKASDAPALYSGSYGLGSRDLQPSALIGAIENMLPDGKNKRFFYLGIEFYREAATPKQEIHLTDLVSSYPQIKDLAIDGSENPNLMPEGSITVRMHSVGGWGAITTGKNLVMTLYELLGFDIKANPKYGSEKKGQPTTYYLSAAPEPIRLNCEYHYVDVVLSPDPNVFQHSNPLHGLDNGGVFIIQSNLDTPEEVWAQIPRQAQQYIVEHGIRIYYVDGFRIAREEATNPELQFRMQGNAFQGAFFAASPLMERNNMTEETLLDAIENQLQDKFGSKGARVVQDNLKVVRRGFDEIVEITEKTVGVTPDEVRRQASNLPVMLKQLPEGDGRLSDIHRFWEQTGSFYISGKGNDNLADPYMATGLTPVATGFYRDMTQIRFEYPEFIAEKCTACGDCYSVCPDSAIPGLVNSISEIFNSTIMRIERGGNPTRFLRREVRSVEKKLRDLIEQNGEEADVSKLIDHAVLETLAESELQGKERESLEREFTRLMETIGDFRFSITKPYYSTREKRQKGSGGFFSVTINPYTCKGCMECIDVCDDEALIAVTQTEESIERMRREWNYWLDLPSTNPDFIRIDDLDEKIGALETLLLDKRNYNAMLSGDGACLGCGEKTSVHLFAATVTALLQPRIQNHLEKIDGLINQLETRVCMTLADNIDLDNTEAFRNAIDSNQEQDLTLGTLSHTLEEDSDTRPLNQEWLKEITALLDALRDLKWKYTEGQTKQGRAEMGIINATGCTSVWGSTFPYNPYPFPWANHLFQDAPSMAMGIFEGHMAKMAGGFKAIRKAELILADKYDPAEHNNFFTYFNWKQFSDDEWHLCPPVVAVGGDGAMYDIGFQNLSRALMSGMPVKMLVLDTQVYSNTGGQACTSGFIGQVSDMAPYGKAWKGKEEIRKEISLIGMAHRTSYVLQGAISNMTHMIEGFVDGLNSRRPALFNLYAVCQPEHGVGDDASEAQSKMAVESRAYPLFRYDPDAGETLMDCSDIEGNPSLDEDWPTYTLNYIDEEGEEKDMDVPMTFADFAMTEGRFRKNFRQAPPETWNDSMIQLHEFIDLDEDERDGMFSYIWGVDGKNRLMRVLVSQEMVKSTEERRSFWRQLKSLAGVDQVVNMDEVKLTAKAEVAQQLTATLMGMAAGNLPAGLLDGATGDTGTAATAAGGGNGATDFEPVWVETPECTTCDECIEINPNIFAYDDNKQAVVINPTGGAFKDIVRAAEKCTAGCLHPGTPFNPDEPGLEKLVQRAAKYQ